MEEAVESRPLSLKYNLLIWRLINVRLILYESALTVKLFLHRARPDQATSMLVACIWFDLGWEAAGNKKGADAPSLFWTNHSAYSST